MITRAYVKRSTVQCMHKDAEGRCPFRLRIKGYFSVKTTGMEIVHTGTDLRDRDELKEDPRFFEKVYSAPVIVKHGAHSHKRYEHLVRRFLPLHMTEEAIFLRTIGRISFSDVVTYLEEKHAIYVSGRAL